MKYRVVVKAKLKKEEKEVGRSRRIVVERKGWWSERMVGGMV